MKIFRQSKTPTLRSRGFVGLETECISWSDVDQFLRHPAVLLLIGFVLSGVLGSWLTYAYQERERNREAAIQSMNELRGSFDDFIVTYNEYTEKIGRLTVLLESNVPPEQIEPARTAYSEMAEK
jgi:hypothetical protein